MPRGRPTGVDFVTAASRYIGTPYVWGGESPSGFDCSGLVEFTLTKLGVKGVPRTSEEQWSWVKKVNYSRLQAGDLVFLNFAGEAPPGHVMIYAGGNKVIQAPSTGQLVQVSQFTPGPPGTSTWGGTIVGYGRAPGVNYRGEQYDPALPVTSTRTTGVGGSSGLYQAPPRPGAANSGAGDYAVLGIPGTPDLPGGSLNPLNDPFGLPLGPVWGGVTTLWDGASSVNDTVSGIKEALKLTLWLFSPKHWAMLAEIVVGAALIGVGIFWLGGGDAPDIPLPFGIGRTLAGKALPSVLE